VLSIEDLIGYCTNTLPNWTRWLVTNALNLVVQQGSYDLAMLWFVNMSAPQARKALTEFFGVKEVCQSFDNLYHPLFITL
jgi:hypothetical protein